MNENTVVSGAGSTVNPSLVTYTHIIYGLHALTVVGGILTSASIIGSFILGWPSIIAVIMNYVKRSEVRGTYLESHFSWQIRTFWTAFIASVVVGCISLVLAVILIGFALWMLFAFVIGIWVLYRVVRGWLALKDRKPIAL